jgi:hypothetical protein
MADEIPNMLDCDLAIRKYWDTYAQKSIQEARDAIERERKFFTWALSLTATFAGALLCLATFLGFTSIKNAQNAEIAKVQQEIDGTVQKTLSTELTSARLQGAIAQVAAKLAGPDAEAKLAQILAEQNYVRLDGQYLLRNDSSGRILDVLNAGKDQSYLAPVNATPDSHQTWTLVRK